MSAAARNKNGQASPSIETTHPRPAVIVGPTLPATTPFPYTTLFRSGGSISWKLYDNKTCSSSEGGLIASDGPVAVSGNGDYSTPAGSSPTQAGTYYWVASYSGDDHNSAPMNCCDTEPVLIGQASTSIETTQTPPAGIVGATFKDTSSIARLFRSRPARFPYTTLFRSKTCSSSEGGLIASDGPVAVSGNGDYSTPAGSSPTQAGTYYWVASYSGDANNKEARSEERRVGKEISHASPSNETTKTPPAGIVGATFKDKATIAGLFGSFSGA